MLSARKVIAVVVLAGVVATGQAGAQQQGQAPAQRAVEPNAVAVDEYVPNQYLDPNLLAIQVRRAEDRILALEETNERLIRGYNDLAEKYNALREYLNTGVVLEQ